MNLTPYDYLCLPLLVYARAPMGYGSSVYTKRNSKGIWKNKECHCWGGEKNSAVKSQFTEPYDSPLLLSLINPLQKHWDKKEVLMTCILKQLNISPLKEF